MSDEKNRKKPAEKYVGIRDDDCPGPGSSAHRRTRTGVAGGGAGGRPDADGRQLSG